MTDSPKQLPEALPDDQLDFRKFQRERGGALLPLGTVYPYVPAVQLKNKIIAVRTHGSIAPENVSLKSLSQLLLKRFHETVGICNRDGWLVNNFEMFLSVTHSKMQIARKKRKLFDELGTV